MQSIDIQKKLIGVKLKGLNRWLTMSATINTNLLVEEPTINMSTNKNMC